MHDTFSLPELHVNYKLRYKRGTRKESKSSAINGLKKANGCVVDTGQGCQYIQKGE